MPFPRLIDPAALMPEPIGRRPKRRSVWAFGLLAFGFLLARFALPRWPELQSGPLWFGAAAALLVPVILLRGHACRSALALAVIAFGIGFFTLRLVEHPRDSLIHRLSGDALTAPVVLRVQGRITTDPESSTSGCRFTLAATHLVSASGREPVSGRLRIHIDAPLSALASTIRAGERVEFIGPVRRIAPALNPGEPPRDLYAAEDRVIGSAVLPSPDLLIPLHSDSPWTNLRTNLAGLQSHLHAGARRTLGLDRPELSRGQALIAAMLLGEREPALAEAESAFQRAGLMHLVAISGFNLMVLSFLAVLLVRLTGDHGRIESLLAAVVIGLYMFILPGEASILRAGLTLLLFLFTDAFGRRYDRLTMLGWTAIVILLIHPMDLFSLGFQLSFGIVAALMAFGEAVHRRLWGVPIAGTLRTPAQRRPRRLALGWLAEKLKLQISAAILSWAIAAPLIAHHTGLFSPLAVITTLIVLPITIVILWIGYAALLIGAVVPPMAEPISRLLAGLGEFTVRTVLAIDQWPWATITLPRLGAMFTLAATIVVLYWLIRGHMRDGLGYLGAVLIGLWLAALLLLGPRLAPGVPYRLDILAMGDAQCQLLRTGEHAVLIGAGQPGHTPRPEQLVRTLRQLDAPRIQTVVIPDLRQQTWASLPGILDRLHIRTVLVPPAFPNAAILDPNGPHARLLRTLHDRHITVRSIDIGDRFSVGHLVVSVVGPSGRPATQKRLCLRIDTPTNRGSVLLGASSSMSDIAAMPATERRCDALILPATFRASEKPVDSIRLSRAFTLIHSGSLSAAAELSQRIADAAHIRFTSLEGAMRIEPTRDGHITIAPIR